MNLGTSWTARVTLFCLILSLVGNRTANAQDRNFQMALFGDNANASDSEFSFFRQETGAQASGRSIMLFDGWKTTTWQTVTAQGYDFSRIVAVLVDEPYWNDHCDGNPTCIAADFQTLQSLGQAIKQTSPATRFWINFSKPEMEWMMDSGATLFGSFVDILSMDLYGVDFPATHNPSNRHVGDYYNWLNTHLASSTQQMALVPGTFVSSGCAWSDTENDATQAGRLTDAGGFFEYANSINTASCLQGQVAGCPIWLVMGFLGVNSDQGGGCMFHGEFGGNVPQIHAAWTGELSKTPAARAAIAVVSKYASDN